MRFSILLFLVLILGDACVERVTIKSPFSTAPLVIEGQVTTEPGPYTVKLSRATNVNDILVKTKPVSAVRVTIMDNIGNSEVLTEVEIGTFKTNVAGMRGVVGRSYSVRVETNDGKVYESTPEKIIPAGEISSLYYDFEVSQPANGPTEYGYRFYADTKGAAGTDNLLRWRFSGIYRVTTNPELFCEKVGEGCAPRPRACSGYILSSEGLTKVAPCDCCDCYVSAVDSQIKLSDNQTVSDGQFKKIEMGYLKLDYYTSQKTLVEVKQYSLSASAFAYWKTLKDQKEGSASLFQPAIGKARSNIFVKNSSEEVQGLFYASDVISKTVLLEPKNLPAGLKLNFDSPPTIAESCLLAFKNSTTQKPVEW